MFASSKIARADQSHMLSGYEASITASRGQLSRPMQGGEKKKKLKQKIRPNHILLVLSTHTPRETHVHAHPELRHRTTMHNSIQTTCRIYIQSKSQYTRIATPDDYTEQLRRATNHQQKIQKDTLNTQIKVSK